MADCWRSPTLAKASLVVLLLMVCSVVSQLVSPSADYSPEPPTPFVGSKPTTTTPTPTRSLSPVAGSLDDLSSYREMLTHLETAQTTLFTQLRDTETELELLEIRLSNEQRFYAEARAAHVVQNALPSPRGATVRPLECQGWKKTARCRTRGERRPALDRSCLDEIRGGAAGYCEARDMATGESFKVMRVDCATVRPTATFWCELAPQFANFPADIERVVVEQATQAKVSSAATTKLRGIIFVALASQLLWLERTVQTLRSLGCELPIEIWYFEADMVGHAWKLNDVRSEWRPLTSLPYTSTMVAYAKIHALVQSQFTQVLYLDVNVDVLRDPTYLFTMPEFQTTGAIFWPDAVHPTNPESTVVATSLLWELLDMPFVSMFEQDDRQLLIDRGVMAVRTALRVLELFAAQRPSLFAKLELVDGVKDFFRLAWLKTRSPFHLVAAPPTLGGSVLADGRFCGSHIVQHDPSGKKLFVHRQRQDLDDVVQRMDIETIPFTHVQEFDWRQQQGRPTAFTPLSETDIMFKYDVRSFTIVNGDNEQKCLAHTASTETSRVTTTEWHFVSATVDNTR